MNQEKAPLDYQKFVSNIASTIAQQFRSVDARPEPEPQPRRSHRSRHVGPRIRPILEAISLMIPALAR